MRRKHRHLPIGAQAKANQNSVASAPRMIPARWKDAEKEGYPSEPFTDMRPSLSRCLKNEG